MATNALGRTAVKALDSAPGATPASADAKDRTRADRGATEDITAEHDRDEETQGAEEPPARKRRAPVVPLAVLGAALLAGGWYGYGWWTHGRFQVSTDDAYVEAHVAVIAPKLSGYVAAVLARENAQVSTGDPLLKIEDGDYRDALRSAEADLAARTAALQSADRRIEAARAAVAQARARQASAEAAKAQAEADYARYGQLAATSIASAQKLDATRSAAEIAEASVAEARAGVLSAQAELAVVEAQRAETEAAIAGLRAARDHAARTLDATVLRAPFDGVVGNLSVAVGDYVTPGKRLLAVAPLTDVFVEANYKETQIGDIAVGAEARLEIDAYPDLELVGRVESLAPASGAIFSLLPPENATGNFTKVVQRVPVRISVPAEVARRGLLRPGMSVVVTIDKRAESEIEAETAHEAESETTAAAER